MFGLIVAKELREIIASTKFVVTFLVCSLFTILFVYNTVSRENEQGTLRLAFSNAVPRNTLFLEDLLPVI